MAAVVLIIAAVVIVLVRSRSQAPYTTLQGSGIVNGVTFSPDGKTLAEVGQDHTAVWNLATGQPTDLADPDGRGTRTAAFSPDGKLLAVTDGNGHVYLWGTATSHLDATFTGPGNMALAGAVFSAMAFFAAVSFATRFFAAASLVTVFFTAAFPATAPVAAAFLPAAFFEGAAARFEDAALGAAAIAPAVPGTAAL